MSRREKYHCQEALSVINGPLAAELDIKRRDALNRTKAHLFEFGDPGGRQFGLVVGDMYATKKPNPAKQTRILLERCVLPNILGIEQCNDDYNGSRVTQADSRLAPPNQTSCLVADEAALTALLRWYARPVATLRANPPRDAIAIERAQVETCAREAGFNISPVQEGAWAVFRSTMFPNAVGIVVMRPGVYKLGLSNPSWGTKAANDCGHTAVLGTGPWPALVEEIRGFDALQRQLVRAATLGHIFGEAPVAAFRAQSKNMPASTEAERLVIQRLGQAIFRQSLIEYWQGRCAVTGLDITPLLRASHIKQWAKCKSDFERLDVYNGLLLAPHLDALFDGGWITFRNTGEIRVSGALSPEQRMHLGVVGTERVVGLSEGHFVYLGWHRENLFRTASGNQNRVEP